VSFYNNDSVGFNSLEIMDGKVNVDPSTSGEYLLKTVSSDGKDLFTTSIPLQFSAHIDKLDANGKMIQQRVDLKKVVKFIRLPYLQNAQRFEVYHGGRLIFSLDIPEKLCIRDGDCSDYCQNNNDPDCPPAANQGNAKASGYDQLSLNGILIFLLLAVVFLVIRYRLRAKDRGDRGKRV
jgi:hypothetical protein